MTQKSTSKNENLATNVPDTTLSTPGRSNSKPSVSAVSKRITSRHPNIWEGRLWTYRGRHVDKSGEM